MGNSIFVDSLEVPMFPYVSICFHLILNVFRSLSIFKYQWRLPHQAFPKSLCRFYCWKTGKFLISRGCIRKNNPCCLFIECCKPLPFSLLLGNSHLPVSFVTSCIPRPHHFLWWLLEMHEYRSPSWWWWQRLSESPEEILTTRWCFELGVLRISQGSEPFSISSELMARTPL